MTKRLFRLLGSASFKVAVNELIAHLDRFHLPLMQQLQKFAIRRDLDLLRRRPPLLKQHDGDQGEEQIADVEMPFLFHGLFALEYGGIGL